MRTPLLQDEITRSNRDDEFDSKPVDGAGFAVVVISGP